ncbi:hypothetical protein WH47_12816 [Habropoda laboriosa]|uniref:Uncharacterized protein n=1 Tax=Habropoda laboriosa TaxID=597456 RepID=A0A0L7R558_9HYME|nr:hypothetical protein WH47_12816 [Habropoda laboriosa]
MNGTIKTSIEKYCRKTKKRREGFTKRGGTTESRAPACEFHLFSIVTATFR